MLVKHELKPVYLEIEQQLEELKDELKAITEPLLSERKQLQSEIDSIINSGFAHNKQKRLDELETQLAIIISKINNSQSIVNEKKIKIKNKERQIQIEKDNLQNLNNEISKLNNTIIDKLEPAITDLENYCSNFFENYKKQVEHIIKLYAEVNKSKIINHFGINIKYPPILDIPLLEKFERELNYHQSNWGASKKENIVYFYEITK